MGLFNTGDNVVLKNFWLDETCVINANEDVGLIGLHWGTGARFEGIGNAGNINTTGANAGGLFGRAYSSSGGADVSTCWTSGKITSTGRGAAFVGWFTSGGSGFRFKNCWTIAEVSNPTSDGTYVARYGTQPSFTNCWSLNGSQVGRVGNISIFNSGRFCWYINNRAGETVWYQTVGEDMLPVLDPSHGIVYRVGKANCNNNDTEETIYTNTPGEIEIPEHVFEEGICANCNSYDPELIVDGVFQIGTPTQLVWFSNYTNTVDNYANARLTADIDMQGINFIPIGLYGDDSSEKINYYGTFDGAKHIISNLYISTDGMYEAGLISRAYKATVKDLGIVNSTVISNNASGRIGVIAGFNRESNFINCWTAGTFNLTCTYEGTTSPQIGGLFGNTNNTAKCTNCWSLYEGVLGTGNGTFTHCYSFAENENIEEDAQNGSLCLQLNGGSFINPQWFQNIGEDLWPSQNSEKQIIYMAPYGIESLNPNDETSFSTFLSNITAIETTFTEETIAYIELLDEYQSKVNLWETCETFDEFCMSFNALQELKQKIDISVEAYKNYIEACEYATTYLNENKFKSEMRTFLETYLNENEAPSDVYPNGTYNYIISERPLNNEQVASETAYVNDLLQQTIATNITPGSEITITMNNKDFKEGFNYWTVESTNGSMSTGGETSIMTLAQGQNSVFSVEQKLQDIPNGIYVLSLNSFTRTGDDIYSQLHVGQLYLNGTSNFIMTIGEDVVSKENAEDGVNCLLTGNNIDTEYIYEEIEGYVPSNLVGCSYAFNAGRYLNYTATEVTDSTLTIGVRNLGSDPGNDWLPFGSIRVFYLGTAEQASEALDNVLDGYVARANIIYDFIYDDALDYAMMPNYSEQLKTELENAIENRALVETGEQKMALINTFSDLFNKIYECRNAYIALLEATELLMDKATRMINEGIIDEDTYTELLMKVSQTIPYYQQGTVSTEEALDIAAELNEINESLGGIQKDKEGRYLLKDANDMMVFASLVNAGETEANALMMNDIDMSSVENFPGIGVPRNDADLSRGTFDGQGHKISNLTISYPGKEDIGLFHIGKATLKNFWLDETCTIEGDKGVGLVGWCNGDSPQFENVGNAAKIKGGENASAFIGRAWKNPIFKNCWSVGTIDNNAGGGTKTNTGVFIGWCNTWGASFTNCWTTSTFTIAPAASNYLTRKNDNCVFTNTYTIEGSQATKTTMEEVKSGALCYNLNENAGEIIWYQTIGVDTIPYLDPSHGVVYLNANQNCDGTPKGEVIFSNTDVGTVRDPHNLVDGVCSVCGAYNPDDIIDGVYQIGTPAQLVWFSNYVNQGNILVKAVLTADIDMSSVENFTPIGIYHDSMTGVPDVKITYQGTFDGMGHVIRNLTVNVDDYYEAGLFSRTQNSVIQNLGVVNATVSTNNPKGRAGVISGLNHNATIQNCFTTGTIVLTTTESVTAFGGIAGVAPNANSKYINCYSTYEGPLVTLENGAATITNCYSYAENAGIEADAKSGKLCYDLNSGAGELIFYQTIGVDDYPVLDATHDEVIMNEDGTYGNATGINIVTGDASKSIIYDLLGRRIEKSQLTKGLYIVNGKKVLIK